MAPLIQPEIVFASWFFSFSVLFETWTSGTCQSFSTWKQLSCLSLSHSWLSGITALFHVIVSQIITQQSGPLVPSQNISLSIISAILTSSGRAARCEQEEAKSHWGYNDQWCLTGWDVSNRVCCSLVANKSMQVRPQNVKATVTPGGLKDRPEWGSSSKWLLFFLERSCFTQRYNRREEEFDIHPRKLCWEVGDAPERPTQVYVFEFLCV